MVRASLASNIQILCFHNSWIWLFYVPKKGGKGSNTGHKMQINTVNLALQLKHADNSPLCNACHFKALMRFEYGRPIENGILFRN